MTLLEKINAKRAKIGVIGLGYVGLPLAVLLAKKGFKVSGFVRNEKRKKEFSKIFPLVNIITSSNLANQDIIIVCVPTPVDKNKNPDLTHFKNVANRLSKIKLDGKLLVNESTVAPFTTREILGNFPYKYFLVASPERIDPGNQDMTTENVPKVIGGISRKSLELGVALYSKFMKAQIVSVSSLEVAEMTKMLENTYRNVNIALINEFAKLAQKCRVDILEVINAAKTKWSFQAHYPGIGVGGHCIPVDPYYIVALAKKKRVALPVTQAALSENEKMPKFVADKVTEHHKKGMSVLVYGITYKRDVPDLRESPVIAFCNILKSKGISFNVYDPFFNKKDIENLGFNTGYLKIVDMLIVGTDHTTLIKDSKKLIGENTFIIDGRNFFTLKMGKGVFGVGRNLL